MAAPVNKGYAANGRKGAAKSPWRAGPHATTKRAAASFDRYCERGKAKGEVTMHPNDKLYALDRAVQLAEEHGEPRNVVEDLRQLREEAQREARK